MRESISGGEAVDVEELLRKMLEEEARKDGEGGEEERKRVDKGVMHGIARMLAYNGVITRGKLEELSKGSSAGRQMIAFLKKCGLLYETRSGYILSVPWLVYFYKSLGEEWIERVRRLAPYIRDNELRELEELVREASQGPLGEFVDIYISSFAASASRLEELLTTSHDVEVPEYCRRDPWWCFRELLHYSRWLLTVLAGLLELYAKGVNYGEVINWLRRMARDFQATLLEPIEEDREGGDEDTLGLFEQLVSETARALKRHATLLYETRSGGRVGVLARAVEWAVERYRRSDGRQVGRARYYASILLRETAKAVLADVSTRIALLLP